MTSNHTHYTTICQLGSGSFGVVYKVKDVNGKEWALKQIKIESSGIPCILEPAIMMSIRHPGLNRAYTVFSTDTHLNIVQDMAVNTLSKHVSRKITPLPLVKKWLYIISSSLYALHRFGFIHVDIKGSNVLYFNDDDVRLADFTLTMKLWHKEDTYTQQAGTHSHSPPEILVGNPWNRSVDIWSLGCTFYEIAFGKLLFNYQSKSKDKSVVRQRYHNAIIGWFRDKGQDIQFPSCENYIPADDEQTLNTNEYRELKDLLGKMLKYDATKRINIGDVLNHKFFKGQKKLHVKKTDAIIYSVPTNKLDEVSTRLMRLLLPSTNKINSIDLRHISVSALEIYKRIYPKIKHNTDEIMLCGSCWISSKMIIGIPPILSTAITNNRILIAEREIMNYLSYCLPITNDLIDI